jgi:hypothetical protein
MNFGKLTSLGDKLTEKVTGALKDLKVDKVVNVVKDTAVAGLSTVKETAELVSEGEGDLCIVLLFNS